MAAALPAAAASPAIAHRCSNALFRYTEKHPIGYFNWHYDVPSEYIPGSVNPTNAPLRLTADTRLAFVGAFDGYFRRLLASIAFGTAECTNIVASYYDTPIGETKLRLRSAADWIDDYTITNVFGQANGWYSAANRDYAVTNITVTATNWIGYATNIVYNPAGKPVGVKVENRYEVVSTNILDTTRILERYRNDLDFMRRKDEDMNPVVNMLTATGYDTRPCPAPWPNRRNLFVGRENNFAPYFSIIHPNDFLGWSFSAVAEPSFTHSSGADWETSPYDLFAHLCAGSNFFYTTTWDLFGAENSRWPIMRDMTVNGWYWFLDYDTICPDDWEEFVDFDLGPVQVEGYAAMTNLVGVYLTPSNTPTFSPGFPLTNSTRIGWAEWAGSDAYLALADTAIAGNAAMPRLHYEVAATSGICSITYRGSGADKWLCVHSTVYREPTGVWRRWNQVTNYYFDVHLDGTKITNAHGAIHPTDRRIELASYGNPRATEFSVDGIGTPEDNPAGAPMIGFNYVSNPINENTVAGVLGWAHHYYDEFAHAEPQDGDILTIHSYDGDTYTAPYFVMDGPHGADYDARSYNGEYYLHFRATNIIFEAAPPIKIATTITPRPFDYTLDSTNFVSRPCIYPHPSFVGVEPNGLAEVNRIYPTAIATAAVSTNFTFDAEDDDDDGSDIRPNADGYFFAASVPNPSVPIATAKKVDDFWLDADSALGAKLADEVVQRGGVDPRNIGSAVSGLAWLFDSLVTGEGVGGNTYLLDLLNYNLASGDFGISWESAYYPNTFRVKNAGGSGFELEAVTFTNGQYEAISPQPQYCRHYWNCFLSLTIGDQDRLIHADTAAVGRLSGLEAVKWKFSAMHQPTTNPTP